MTSPDPVPPPLGPLAAIVTTEGTTRSATEVTGQALAVDDDAAVTGLALEPDDCVAPTMTPPTTPPTTSAAPSATHSSHRRGRRGCLDSLTTALGFRPATGHSQESRIHRGPWPWSAPLPDPRWRSKPTCPASFTSSPGRQTPAARIEAVSRNASRASPSPGCSINRTGCRTPAPRRPNSRGRSCC